MKLLLWVVIGLVVVLWVLNSKKSRIASKSAEAARRNAEAKPKHLAVEQMIQCAHCGVHIPASESVAAPSGAVFCSEEHRRLHG